MSLPETDGELARGQLVGQFRVEHLLGVGGTSFVYAATHRSIGKRAAVKVLRARLLDLPVAVDQFMLEGIVANSVEHRNVAGAFGFGHLPDGRPYMLMEQLRGETLSRRLDSRPLKVVEIANIGAQCCRGLSAIHAAGYVHGDVKPDNVFLTTDSEGWEVVKLIDFGTSRPTPHPSASPNDRATFISGTPPYMAPEQRDGYAPRATSDVYALGVMLYEALVGRPPFPARVASEDIECEQLPPAPCDEDSAIPRALSNLIMRMLSRDPAGRPSLDEILDELARSARAHQTGASPTEVCPVGPLPSVALPLPATEDRLDYTAKSSGWRWLPPWLKAVLATAGLAGVVTLSSLALTRSVSSAGHASPANAAASPRPVMATPPVSPSVAPTPAPIASPTPHGDAREDDPVPAAKPPRPPRKVVRKPVHREPPPPRREVGDGTIDPFQ